MKHFALLKKKKLCKYLAYNAANEVIVRKVIFMELFDVWIGVQVLISGQLEEASIGVKCGLNQLVGKLAEKATTVDSCFVKAGSVHQSYPHFQPYIWL